MASKHGDKKSKGSAEAPGPTDSTDATSGGDKKPSRRGGKRKEAPVSTEGPDSKSRKKGRKGRDEATSSAEVVDTATPPEVQTATPPEVETGAPPDVETATPPEVETAAPQEIETAAPQEIETASPQEIETAAPQEIETAAPQEIETAAPQEIETAAPQEIETAAPPKVEPATALESVQPQIAEVKEPPASSAPQKPRVSDPPVATLRSTPVRTSALPSQALASGLEDLPFPVAECASQWKSATTAAQRVQAVARGLTATLQLLAAAQLGRIDAGPARRPRLQAGTILAARGYLNRLLSPFDWARLAFSLAEVAARCPDSMVARVAQGLTDAGGLAVDVEQLLAAVSDPKGLDEELAVNREAELVDLLRTLVALCKPLRNARMISVDSGMSVAGDDSLCYAVQQFGASSPHATRQWVDTPLARPWCYLLDGSAVEACLAPIALGAQCKECGETQLFLADRLVVGPARAEVRVRGMKCGHKVSARLPREELREIRRAMGIWAP
ncbi:MAG: hypothetical protein HY898_29545 [Deltaproteobacteria bacterium]|nr:hypothetical protein [Deltaproteobacteria bacterium]